MQTLGTKSMTVCFMSYDNNLISDDTIYRLTISPDTNCVGVVCLGMNSIDTELEGNYNNVDELPKWVQRKLAVLTLCSQGKDINKVGMRIDGNTFWIYHTQGENYEHFLLTQ